MGTKNTSKLSIFSVLILTVLVGYLYISKEKLNPAEMIASFASVVIALLTFSYVNISSKQLNEMKQQLKEVEKSREQTTQPIVFVDQVGFILERPRLFYSPHEKKYTGQSRFIVKGVTLNVGNAPAVSVIACCCIAIPEEKDWKYFESANNYLDVVSIKEDDMEKGEISFLFADDYAGKVIESMRNHDPLKFPVLQLCIVYKNILGACFETSHKFKITIKDKSQDDILENWQCQLNAFSSLLKNEILEMTQLMEKSQMIWSAKFKESRNKYEDKIKGSDQNLGVVQQPEGFKACIISKDRYDYLISKARYGLHLGYKNCSRDCVVIKNIEDRGTVDRGTPMISD